MAEPASALFGVNVAVVVPALYVTAAGTRVLPASRNSKVDPVTVVAFIASLKVAVTGVVGATPLAPLAGDRPVTVGGVTSAAAVVKVQPASTARALPARSLTRGLTVPPLTVAV